MLFVYCLVGTRGPVFCMLNLQKILLSIYVIQELFYIIIIIIFIIILLAAKSVPEQSQRYPFNKKVKINLQ